MGKLLLILGALVIGLVAVTLFHGSMNGAATYAKEGTPFATTALATTAAPSDAFYHGLNTAKTGLDGGDLFVNMCKVDPRCVSGVSGSNVVFDYSVLGDDPARIGFDNSAENVILIVPLLFTLLVFGGTVITTHSFLSGSGMGSGFMGSGIIKAAFVLLIGFAVMVIIDSFQDAAILKYATTPEYKGVNEILPYSDFVFVLALFLGSFSSAYKMLSGSNVKGMTSGMGRV